MNTLLRERMGNIYSRITNEEDARICKDISDDACKEVPSNFFLIIISSVLTKLGDALSSPKTVLAWLMSYVNAPLAMIGFLVPIRESFSMLPQIIIAGYIRKIPRRKWVWVLGSLLQFLSIAAIGLVSILLKGVLAAWLILLFLLMFSLSRGLSSIASKDVLGKTIPKTRRGRLTGISTSVSGILALGAGLYMIFKSDQDVGVHYYAFLIFLASSMWLLGALVYANVREEVGEISGGGNAIWEAIRKLTLLRDDKPFRNFVISRALLLCSALTAPFYVVLAKNFLGDDIRILGWFIIANGIATSISAPFWGRQADISSKKVMVRAALIAAFLGILMFIIISWVPVLNHMTWLYPAAFFVLGVAHSGVRLGRKTYIVDMAGGNKRTDYVAVSNTVIGLVLLITGGITALASVISAEGIILVLSVFGLAGAYSSFRLPEVE